MLRVIAALPMAALHNMYLQIDSFTEFHQNLISVFLRFGSY